jgi:prolipoprotein diacylglyceryltransferase
MTLTTERAFAVKVAIGLVVSGWFVLWSALRQGTRPGPWLDVYLGTLLGGIIGARLFYVLLHLDRFRHEILNIPRLWYGELSWQGALVGGGLAMWGMLRWRKIPAGSYTDALALALPVGFMAVCWACRSAGLLLGQPVNSLDDTPVWAASFLPDLYRDVGPRYELQMLGVGLGAAMLVVAGFLTLGNWLAGLRLWVILLLASLSILILEYYSGNPPQELYGVPVDQTTGVLLFLFSLTTIVTELSLKRIQAAQSAASTDQL